MHSARITPSLLIKLGLFGAIGLPNIAGGQKCVFPDREFNGTIIVSDFPDGVSSDGNGPYHLGKGGVIDSRAGSEGVLTFYEPTATANSRRFTVNLSKPVPGGGGLPLGTITSNVNGSGFVTQRGMIGDTVENLTDIGVGKSATAAQINVDLRINGRFHVLQMGPQPHGHCMTSLANKNRLHGAGTTSGTIARISPTKWAIDLPQGSVGRLFDIEDGHDHAEDKGLYFVQLHYEIVDAVPHVSNVLLPVAETEGASAVIARYRALRRDSSSAYVFDENQLASVGYWLLEHKKANDAVTVFRLNVDENPEAWTSYGHLADAYVAAGDTTKAIVNYKRSLELNPKGQYAAKALERLGAKP